MFSLNWRVVGATALILTLGLGIQSWRLHRANGRIAALETLLDPCNGKSDQALTEDAASCLAVYTEDQIRQAQADALRAEIEVLKSNASIKHEEVRRVIRSLPSLQSPLPPDALRVLERMQQAGTTSSPSGMP